MDQALSGVRIRLEGWDTLSLLPITARGLPRAIETHRYAMLLRMRLYPERSEGPLPVAAKVPRCGRDDSRAGACRYSRRLDRGPTGVAICASPRDDSDVAARSQP